jgi:hypothetical protein
VRFNFFLKFRKMKRTKVLKNFFLCIFLLANIFLTIMADTNEKVNTSCVDPSLFDFSQCKLPPLLAEKNFKSSDLSKKIVYCNSTSEFLNCMNDKISKLCNSTQNYKNSKSKELFERINNAIRKYNFMYQKNCYGN